MPEEINSFDDKYILKVWATTILLGPVFLFSYAIIDMGGGMGTDIAGIIVAFFYALMIGGVLSLPSFLLYYLVFRQLKTTTLNTLAIKAILALVSSLCILITFYILLDWRSRFDLAMVFGEIQCIYIGTNILASVLFRLKRPAPPAILS